MSATFFIQRLQTFFYFLQVFTFFNVFLNFHLNVYYIYDLNSWFTGTCHVTRTEDTDMNRGTTRAKVARASSLFRVRGHIMLFAPTF